MYGPSTATTAVGATMTELEKNLLSQANEMHSKIFPCAARKEFAQCFTMDRGKLCFWYNTEDQSTHLLVADVGQVEERMPN
jgi:hypothetical protein